MVEILDRGRDIGEHGQALGGDFREAAEHDDLLLAAIRAHRQDAGADDGDERRMSGEHAEIALGARNVDLLDFTGEQKLFRRHEIEVESGHR